MPHIIVNIEGTSHTFTDDKKGNDAAEKLIKQAHSEWIAHPYFHLLSKITALRAKEYEYSKMRVAEAGRAYQYRKKADKIESERNKYLRENPHIKHPGAISVTIRRSE